MAQGCILTNRAGECLTNRAGTVLVRSLACLSDDDSGVSSGGGERRREQLGQVGRERDDPVVPSMRVTLHGSPLALV